MTCIIAGCALVDDGANRTVWGDLWRIGDAWVFNAVPGPKGEAAWQYGAPVPNTMRQLVIDQNARVSNYFERRGVIVLAEKEAKLNPAAEAYLKGEPK